MLMHMVIFRNKKDLVVDYILDFNDFNYETGIDKLNVWRGRCRSKENYPASGRQRLPTNRMVTYMTSKQAVSGKNYT